MLAQPIDIIHTSSYLGIFLLIFLLPVPQELVLPLAGFMVAQGQLNFVYAVLAGVLGSMMGSLPWYWAGRCLGEARLIQWTQRHRQWVKLSPADVQRAKQWFDQSGKKAVLLSQFIPIIRTLIAVPAGFNKMNFGSFLLCLVLSAIAAQGTLVSAGYVLGEQYRLINQYTSVLRLGVIVLVVSAIVWLVRRQR